jgi:CDP-6-deoxy-D-xylo-4-hexulose-3-dehydrase
MAEIKDFCGKKSIAVIEDCCESTGAKIGSTKVGNFGLMGSFSFYFAHHMTTIEGGMIVTNDSDTDDLLRSARSHGWVRGSKRADRYPDSIDKKFLFDMLGYNLRSTNLNAAIGLVQLKKLDSYIENRSRCHKHFLQKMIGLNLGVQKVDIDETSSFSLAVICRSKAEKEEMMDKLTKNGVEVRPIVAGNLLKQPVFKSADYRRDKLTQAEIIDSCGFYFANNQAMNAEKISHVVSLFTLKHDMHASPNLS